MKSSKTKLLAKKIFDGIKSLSFKDKDHYSRSLTNIKAAAKELYKINQEDDNKKLFDKNNIESNFQALAQNAFDGIAINDVKGNYLYVNKKAAEISGYTVEELLSLNIKNLTPKDNIKEVSNKSRNRIEGRTPSDVFESEMLKKDGTKIPIEISASITEWQGEPADMVFFRDISERKRNERIINEKNKELKKINDTKDKLFSIVAHDLKNPFHHLSGLSQLLIEKDYSEDEQEEILKLMHKSIKETYSLLNNLLLWAKTQRGTITYNPQQLNLSSIIKETIELQQAIAEGKNISITSKKIPKNINVWADYEMVSTVLRNITSNALKFTGEGGTITIHYSMKGKNYIKISIKDTGEGISKDQQKKLFKLEETKTANGTHSEKGSGLGLIICKEFVELNGGTIGLSSEPGKGSTFYFTLPAKGNQ